MSALRALAAVAVVASVLVACGDDDDGATSTAPLTDDGPGGDVPDCPGPGATITEALANGCLLDGEQVVVVQQNYDQPDGTVCAIVIWDQDAEGGWGVLGETPGRGAWADNSADPDFDNPCTP